MARPFEDITGQTFGRLTVIERQPSPGRRTMWLCRCSCGGEHRTTAGNLRWGKTKSCGCLHSECGRERIELVRNLRHGHGSNMRGRSPEYQTYRGMRDRCTQPGHPSWKYYGGRGVQVCSRWLGPHGFHNFLFDVGRRPPGRMLDRIDVNGHYTPGNVRWADAKTQANNKRLKRAA
jgi:hypothetical protein